MSRGMKLTALGALMLGILVGVLIASLMNESSDSNVHIMEGYCNGGTPDGTAIHFSLQKDGPSTGYVIAGADWKDTSGVWHSSLPTCLDPETMGQRVRLGIVEADPTEYSPRIDVVVWLECLDN